MPSSASEASSRSSAIVRMLAANSFCSSAEYDGAVVGQRREVGLGDAEVLEHDGARDLVDLRARRREDDAERFVLRAVLLDRERAAEVDPVVGPLVDLRLVDEHLRALEVDDAGPRVGRRLVRRGGGRGLRRRRRLPDRDLRRDGERCKGGDDGDGEGEGKGFHDRQRSFRSCGRKAMRRGDRCRRGAMPSPCMERCGYQRKSNAISGPVKSRLSTDLLLLVLYDRLRNATSTLPQSKR